MPETPPAARAQWRPLALALAAGVVCAALTALGGAAAAIGGWLAQPALALAARCWHQRRLVLAPSVTALRRDAAALALLWGAALAGSGVLVWWPITALRDRGGLGAALGLSAVAGLLVIVLWRTWPVWRAAGRDGGPLGAHLRALGDSDTSGWHGVAAAAAVAMVVAMVLLLAWPDLLGDHARWALAALAVLGWPALHVGLQAFAAPGLLPIPIVEMAGDGGISEPDADTLDGDLDAALFDAARRGRVDRALGLLDAGANPHALPLPEDRDQRTLPVLAAVLPDLRLLRALILAGADLNRAHRGMTPLLAATRDSWHGRPEAVMTLLANGADPRVTDNDGNTPLHHAARSSDPGVAALLGDAAADLRALNRDGFTPLGIACASGNWRLARFLLERGAMPEPEGATPALLAAAGGDEDDAAGVALLLKHKAKPNARSREGRTALHEAAFAGHVEIVTALIDAGADGAAVDTLGRTPLLDAARGGRLAAFEALVAQRASIAVVDGDGRDALMLACLADTVSSPLVRRLIELGADSARTDAEGKRALDHAALAGRWTLVAVLDPSYPLPSSVLPEDGDPPPPDRAPLVLLREALGEGRFDGHERLLGLLTPAELGGLLVDDEAPLSLPRIDWLLAHGADADAPNAAGDTPVFVLLTRGPDALPALQRLLAFGASAAGAGGLARFLAACAAGDQAARALEQCALELLDRGADPYAAAPGGDPPLALAVRLGWMRVLERLIGHGVALDARDSHGMTALHLAAALSRENALKLLVQHGASPDQRAADGQTALGVALSAGRRDLADWLDWRGWPLPKRALREADVPAAATVGDADAVRRLLALGFAVDAVDAQGCTGLLRAAGGGFAAVVELLLERGADPQRAAFTGATPLSAAVSMRHGAIVDRLLAAGAQLEQRLPGDVTVLMLAAALGLPDLVARLLSAGANVQTCDAQGLTALHCAALYGFTARDRARLLALFDTLLLAGADADARAAGGVTPLLLLLGARAEPGTACDDDVVMAALDHLLDEEVGLDVQDPRGFGPLHLAALHGQLRLTQRLLRAGCDPDLRDALNRPPREIALMRGFVDVAAEFAPVRSGVSMARFLRERE